MKYLPPRARAGSLLFKDTSIAITWQHVLLIMKATPVCCCLFLCIKCVIFHLCKYVNFARYVAITEEINMLFIQSPPVRTDGKKSTFFFTSVVHTYLICIVFFSEFIDSTWKNFNIQLVFPVLQIVKHGTSLFHASDSTLILDVLTRLRIK